MRWSRGPDGRGVLITDDLKTRPSQCRNVTLAGRRDLRQHFIVSAALETVIKSGLAYPIGEFKELLDSNSGGSGFSFEDLAADRAGIIFATKMLENALVGTERGTVIGRLNSEKSIFPSLFDLPESMSDADFIRNFGDVKSNKYLKILQEIDHRIKNLSFHTDY